MSNNIKEVARKVLKDEAEGIALLDSFFDENFTLAIKKILEISGKVIVTGVGKSGHIGKKISATLSSTGTPSYFVHPTEASHGDMGMVGSEDIIFAISWSGETSELNDIVHFSKQNNIKLISLTSSSESHLASSADISLILPKVTEACPNGLAPTTSTTMQLIVGDAIAICLLNERGFDKDKFKSLHPGGQLGAALSTLEDIMHKEGTIPLLNSGTNMSEALIKISEKGFGCSGVTKNDELIGIVTDGDLRRHMGPGLLEKTVDEIMNTNPKTVSKNMLATDALDLINELGIQGLFIVDSKKKPAGFVHFHDLIRIIKQ